jgi:hypothetical protein
MSKVKTGRPTVFSEELADGICERLMDGESLREICSSAGMPHRATVVRWMESRPAFATRVAHSRDMQADLMDDLVLEVAQKCTSETAAADRVKIAAYQWRASKLAPKKYGNRVGVDLDVEQRFIPLTDLLERAQAIRLREAESEGHDLTGPSRRGGSSSASLAPSPPPMSSVIAAAGSRLPPGPR